MPPCRRAIASSSPSPRRSIWLKTSRAAPRCRCPAARGGRPPMRRFQSGVAASMTWRKRRDRQPAEPPDTSLAPRDPSVLSVGLAASRRDCSPRRQCERRSFSVSLRSRRCGLVRCATRLAVPSPRPRARSRARAAAGSAPPARQVGPGARQVLAGYQETDATRAHGRARWLRGLRNAPSCSPDCQRPPRRYAAVQSDQLPSICSGLDAVESQGSSSNGRDAVGDNAFCWPISRRSGSELGTELRGRSFASGLPRGVMETEG